MMRMFQSLRGRLLVLATLGMLPAFAVIVVDQVNTRSQRIAEAEAYSLRMTDVVLGEVIRGMTGAATMMIAMRRTSEITQDQACAQYLEGIRQDIPSLVDLAVADSSGQVFCHSGVSALPQIAASAAPVLSAASAPGLQIGTYTDTPAGPALPMAMAIPSPATGQVNYIYLNVILTELEKLVAGAVKDGPALTIVADAQGTILMHLPQGELQPGDKLPEHLATLAALPEPGASHVPDANGVVQILGYRPAEAAPPISIFFSIPEQRVLAQLDRAALVNSLIAGLGTMVAIALAWLVGRYWVQAPVERLLRAVAGRRLGDRGARTGFVEDGTEFGILGASVDHLFDELDAREQAQRLAEEQRDLSAREVQHRVKNLLAIIQVIARQTLSRRSQHEEIKAFEGRIDSIVRANANLLEKEGQGGQIATIVEKALEPFVGSESARIAASGAELNLNPKMGFALSMVLYELATNAAKYGALSAADGHVDLSWCLEGDALVFVWRESGGPAVGEPDHEGFGSMMIKRVLAAETAGSVSLDYRRQGLVFTLTAPLERIAQAD